MREIAIGKHDGGAVSIDLPVLVDSRLLVQANSGGGKSWLLRRLLEQTHGQVQHIVIDPEGEFASLRESFDYVLAGKGGEAAATPQSAKLLAERLLELNVSAICDIYELKAHERVLFVRRFLDALVNASKKLWHPVLVVLDEAHVYCPQAGQAESADAVKDLATRGRKRGFCAVLATQRLSKLHKDAAAECNNKLIGRTSLDVDMKRAVEELGFASSSDRQQLRALRPGEFFAYGPALIEPPTRMTVGTVKTTHPKAGARTAVAPAPASAKVKALLSKLEDLPAEAAEEARTVADLRRDLTVVKRQLTVAQRQAPAQCDHPREIALLEERNRALVSDLEDARSSHDAFTHELADIARRAMERSEKSQTSAPTVVRPRARTDPSSPPRPPAAPRRAAPTAPTNGHVLDGLKSGARRILSELAGRYPATWTRSQVGALTSFSPRGGTFQTYLGELKRRGLVIEESGAISVTDAGLQAVGTNVEPPSSHEEMMARWRKALKAGCYRMLETVVRAGPYGCSREELAELVEMTATGGTFQTYLGILVRNELVAKESDGRLVACDVLWPNGSVAVTP